MSIRLAAACSCRGLSFDGQISLGLTMTSTVPPGRGLSMSLSRHFVPGYDRAVPPEQNQLGRIPFRGNKAGPRARFVVAFKCITPAIASLPS
jgi:hypothetical protein